MLGLRPKLRTRPSLFDLITKKNINQLSRSESTEDSIKEEEEHLPPLPTSPSSVRQEPPPFAHPTEPPSTSTMAPVGLQGAAAA